MISEVPNSAIEYRSLHNNKGMPQLAVLNIDRDSDTDALHQWDENQNDSIETDDTEGRNFSAQLSDDDCEDASNSDLAKETQGRLESPVNSPASKQGRKLKIKGKKVASKARKNKIPKLSIPGSAKR